MPPRAGAARSRPPAPSQSPPPGQRRGPHRPAWNVGRRLALGLLPALLAVALVAGLAYWGEYGRAAPATVVAGAAVLAAGSLAATWWNARYLKTRIARLAATVDAVRQLVDRGEPAEDELDRIEQVIDRLSDALSTAEEARVRAGAAAAGRLRAQGAVVEATARDALSQLDEVRLPIHILLESRFGDLNENQEELLVAARQAGDALDAALRRLGRVAAADQATLAIQRAPVQLNDVARSVEPQVQALAGQRGARLETSLEPGLPRVWGDRAKLAEALVLLAREAVAAAGALAGEPMVVRLHTARGTDEAVLSVAPFGVPDPAVEWDASATTDASSVADRVLALRLLDAQGARVQQTSSTLSIHLPTV